MHEPTQSNPNVCVEVHTVVRRATPTRVLHFGYPGGLTESDVQYLTDVLGTIVTGLINRTVGSATQLPF